MYLLSEYSHLSPTKSVCVILDVTLTCLSCPRSLLPYDAPVFFVFLSSYIVCWREWWCLFLIFLSIQSGNKLSHWNAVLSSPISLLDTFEVEPVASDHYFFCLFSNLGGLVSSVLFFFLPRKCRRTRQPLPKNWGAASQQTGMLVL